MAIPKIKIYRLDNNYSQLEDNDIQSISNDELLPVVPKELNPLNVEEMVGVKERRDSRMVVESEWKLIKLSIDETFLQSKDFVQCDNWVLGKGNFKVFVKKQLNDSGSESPVSESSSEQFSFENLIYDVDKNGDDGNGWYEIDRKFWDYEINTYKMFRVGTEYILEPSQQDEITSVNQINTIVFRLGSMLTSSTAFFEDGYDKYQNIEQIVVLYKTFRELMDEGEINFSEEDKNWSLCYKKSNDTDDYGYPLINEYNVGIETTKNEQDEIVDTLIKNTLIDRSINSKHSRYRVPFGNIYNGNKQGRKLGDKSSMNYYEGNYMYKKKILPLRCRKYYNSQNISELIINIDLNWIVDGIMKPVIMQKITVSNGVKNYEIFKQLEQNLQYTMSLITTDANYYYKLNFQNSYYNYKGNKYFPENVYVFYNYADDVLGNLFDFNYNYNQFIGGLITSSSSNIDEINNKEYIMPWDSKYITQFNEYGYANRGNLILNSNYEKLINQGYIYKKCEKLAVFENFGYDESRDLKLTEKDDGSISFSMENDKFVKDFGYKIYIDGKLICDTIDISSSPSSNLVSSIFEVKFDQTTTAWTITKSDDSVSFPKDLMLVFYEQHEMTNAFLNSSSQKSNEQQYIIGYRIPCYEKVKTSTLFVSSFPNWVKGHLNNDLDVFVGNHQYSGTTLDTTNVDAIYPRYFEDGWYAFYSEGAIQFAQEQTEYDYFDVFNYGSSMNVIEVDKNDWASINDFYPNYIPLNLTNISSYKLIYNKIKYNVAHYDGIYAVLRGRLSNYSIQNGFKYALLQDDEYLDSIGKKLVIRNDNCLRHLYESNLSVLPEKINVSNEEVQHLIQYEINGMEIHQIQTKTDRINVLNFIPSYENINASGETGNGKSAIICLHPNIAENKKIENEAGINDSYVRIHMKVTTPSENGEEKYMFSLGLDSGGQGEENINWYDLPQLEDSYDDEQSLDFVQTKVQDIGQGIIEEDETIILKRYKYSNENWQYDVYFEIFSYRHSLNQDSDNNFPVTSVEIIVYKIDRA